MPPLEPAPQPRSRVARSPSRLSMPTLRPTDPDRAEREPADLPPSRPLLRPIARWARWALVFLLAFTFLRGAVWAVTFPSWLGPDEDYHFLYIENLTKIGRAHV